MIQIKYMDKTNQNVMPPYEGRESQEVKISAPRHITLFGKMYRPDNEVKVS